MFKFNRSLGLFILLGLFLLVFSLSFVYSDYSIGENKSSDFSKTEYGPNKEIKGWINISFDNHPLDSLILDDKGKNITLYNLIKNSSLNENFGNYTCTFPDCEPFYGTRESGQTEQSFTLEKNQSAIYGMEFNSNISEIYSIGFDITSDAPKNCQNQIEVDFFDNEKIDVINKEKINEDCEKRYGCFNNSVSQGELNDYIINDNSLIYCQKINISRSPGVNLGAWVKKESGPINLNMRLYDKEGTKIDECALPSPSESGSEIDCPINHTFGEKEETYYACILGTGLNENSKALIKGYSDKKKCGSPNTPNSFNSVAAYKLFAIEKKFNNVGLLSIENKFSNKKEIANETKNYIKQTYGNLDCSDSPCIVPIKINSNVYNQEISLNNLDVDIQTSTGSPVIDKFYNVVTTSSGISSDYGKLYINEGNFLTPEETGNFTFELILKTGDSEEEILSKELTVVEIPEILSLTPLEAPTSIPTNFKVNIDSSSEIVRYKWDFGDNSTKITTKNNVTHTYNATGNYTILVNITDQHSKKNSKSFRITATPPRDMLENMLIQKKDNLKEIENDLQSFADFEKDMIKKQINFENNKKALNEVDNDYTGDNTDEEITSLAQKLVGVNFPSSISVISSGEDLSYYPEEDYIEPEILSYITNESYNWENKEKYVSNINSWIISNTEHKISYKKVIIQKEEDSDNLNFLTISINKKPEGSLSDYYFVMKKLGDLAFNNIQESDVENENYIYSKLSGSNSISFSTKEEVEFNNIPYFISPDLGTFGINNTTTDEPEEKSGIDKKWIWYSAGILGLAILGFVGYYFLQRWYDRKYEDTLFKDKNKLYNLANYVTRAKEKGISNKKIKENLKKSNWSNEQINYIMKKYAGKRTGLPRLFGSKPKKPKN